MQNPLDYARKHLVIKIKGIFHNLDIDKGILTQPIISRIASIMLLEPTQDCHLLTLSETKSA